MPVGRAWLRHRDELQGAPAASQGELDAMHKAKSVERRETEAQML
jgi:hypothetical protein